MSYTRFDTIPIARPCKKETMKEKNVPASTTLHPLPSFVVKRKEIFPT